jgi:hypothetical protein
LLGSDLETVETDAGAAEDTSVADAGAVVEEEQPGAEGEQTEGDTQGTDEDAEGIVEGGENEPVEEDFNLAELETDYAESAYAKAAAHYSKTFGKPLDPNDQGDRALLRELMDRGQKIKELSAQPREDDHKDEQAAVTQQASQPTKTPQELMQARLAGAKQYAKESVVPEVAMDFAQSFVDAMWPGKNVKVGQEQAVALTQAFTAFGAMLVGDAIPSILSATPKAVADAYPRFTNLIESADKEAAVQELAEATGKDGSLSYPGIDKMIDNGTIKRIMDAELKDAVFNKDPYKNFVAKAQTAYRMARGQNVDTNVVQNAFQRGAKQAKERAARVGAGRVSPGSSRTASAGSGKDNFVQSLVSNGGSKFSNMLKELGK